MCVGPAGGSHHAIQKLSERVRASPALILSPISRNWRAHCAASGPVSPSSRMKAIASSTSSRVGVQAVVICSPSSFVHDVRLNREMAELLARGTHVLRTLWDWMGLARGHVTLVIGGPNCQPAAPGKVVAQVRGDGGFSRDCGKGETVWQDCNGSRKAPR